VANRQAHDVADIQHARDVLAKWVESATPGPWQVSKSGNWVTSDAGDIARVLGDPSLIVGTAGNLDLLDAIDDMLKHTAIMSTNSTYRFSTFGRLAERIAAAIIAADERMTA
jgi:hypothetical protein